MWLNGTNELLNVRVEHGRHSKTLVKEWHEDIIVKFARASQLPHRGFIFDLNENEVSRLTLQLIVIYSHCQGSIPVVLLARMKDDRLLVETAKKFHQSDLRSLWPLSFCYFQFELLKLCVFY